MGRSDDLERLAERVSSLERAFQIITSDSPLDRLDREEKKRSPVEVQIDNIARRLADWESEYETQQVETIDVLASLTKELADSGFKTTQVLPVTVFLDTNRTGDVIDVSRAIGEFLTSIDLDLFFESGEWGSWFGRSFARSKKALASQGVKDTLTRAERALEIQTLHIPQAQIDAMQADAAAKLIAALGPTPNAIVQIGSVLLVKVDGTPIVRNLTQTELSYLEHNKHLYKSPKNALEELGRVSGDAARFTVPLAEQVQISGQDIEPGN
jgi:hypothetical protein